MEQMLHPDLTEIKHGLFDETLCLIQHGFTMDRIPLRPRYVPDPGRFDSFPEWLEALKAEGVDYKDVARAAGCSAQAVSLWKKGGAVTLPYLVALAAWAGLESYQDLQRLVDQPRVRQLNRPVPDSPAAETQRLIEVLSDVPDEKRKQLMEQFFDIARLNQKGIQVGRHGKRAIRSAGEAVKKRTAKRKSPISGGSK